MAVKVQGAPSISVICRLSPPRSEADALVQGLEDGLEIAFPQWAVALVDEGLAQVGDGLQGLGHHFRVGLGEETAGIAQVVPRRDDPRRQEPFEIIEQCQFLPVAQAL